MTNRIGVYVYLGASLSLGEAHNILPSAHYLPPVKCGDILHLLRMNPAVIIIIDGYFAQVPSVWHKEILYALSQGVHVYGASSMGALRAAELYQYGMQGRGVIFEHYRSGQIEDDDEVALAEPLKAGDDALSIAMVNVRATLDSAKHEGIIDTTLQEILINIAKPMYYLTRTFEKVGQAAIKQGVSANSISRFLTWVSKGGYVNQKREDAITLLQEISAIEDQLLLDPYHYHHTFNAPMFFRAMQLEVACSTFPMKQPYPTWLPEVEKIALLNQYNKKYARVVTQIAYLLALLHHLPKKLVDHIPITKLNIASYCHPESIRDIGYINRIGAIHEKSNLLDTVNIDEIQVDLIHFLKLTNQYHAIKVAYAKKKQCQTCK